MIMSRNQQPTYSFGDDAPVTNSRRGKHRRGRGYGINRSKNNSTNDSNSDNNATPKSNNASTQQSSFRQGGHHISSAAARASALSAGAKSMISNQRGGSNNKQRLNLRQQPQSNHFNGDAFDNPTNTNFSRNGSNGSQHNGNDQDQNSCTGSLTYSASSSVQSAESSNDSSFADIIKLIDSEGEGASEIKDFIAKQSKAASTDPGGGGAGVYLHGKGGGEQYQSSAAVQGWMKRVEDRGRQHQAQQQAQAQQQQQAQMQMAQAQQYKKKHNHHSQRDNNKQQQQQYQMGAGKYRPNPNVDLNYSKDDSSEEDPFGATVDFDERVLETIGGLDRSEDDIPTRHNVTVTSQSQSRGPQVDPFAHQDPFHPSSPYNSAPSSPRSGHSNGHVTPPPNSRQKRTSTPPGAASNISRTGSRHSKSSSDGSWDTPAPASPPHGSNGHGMMGSAKPPHARTPVSKSRRSGGRDDPNVLALEDPSEAFYAKSWMCGFADAFNFDGFDKNLQQK